MHQSMFGENFGSQLEACHLHTTPSPSPLLFTLKFISPFGQDPCQQGRGVRRSHSEATSLQPSLRFKNRLTALAAHSSARCKTRRLLDHVIANILVGSNKEEGSGTEELNVFWGHVSASQGEKENKKLLDVTKLLAKSTGAGRLRFGRR